MAREGGKLVLLLLQLLLLLLLGRGVLLRGGRTAILS